jgi:hypothetical protein
MLSRPFEVESKLMNTTELQTLQITKGLEINCKQMN